MAPLSARASGREGDAEQLSITFMDHHEEGGCLCAQVLSFSTDVTLCLCHGRGTRRRGQRGGDEHPQGCAAPPDPTVLVVLTHTLTRREKERATVSLGIARQYNEKKTNNPSHFKKDC